MRPLPACEWRIDSLPQELDEIERQIRQLEIERQALKKEQDRASKDRLNAIERELANLQERGKVMRSQWQQEKALIQKIASSRRGRSSCASMPSAARAHGGFRSRRPPQVRRDAQGPAGAGGQEYRAGCAPERASPA